MGTLLNRRRYMGGGGGEDPLPGGAVRVKYLESNGNQYIDTGVNLLSRMKMRVVFTLTNTEAGRVFCGAAPASNRECCLTMMSYSGIYLTSVYYGKTRGLLRLTNSYIGTEFEFTRESVNSSLVYHDTSGKHEINQTQSGSDYDTGKNCYLFGMNGAGRNNLSNLLSKTQISEFQLADGDTLLANYVACKKDGVGYMYDYVSGNFFGNDGTDNFIIGPVI